MMKKKILSLALALALCLGLTIPAFAETWTETIDGITITAYPNGSISYTGTGKLSAKHADRAVEAVLSVTKVDNLNTFTFSISVGQGITITNEFKNVWMDRGLSVTYNNSSAVVQTVGGFTDVKMGDYFADPVVWAVGKKITAGTSDTTFSPNQNCTVAQILTFLWRANGTPKYSGKNPFSDVKDSDYYYNAALWAYEKGMVTGSTFGGDRPCTRAMAATYMWKLYEYTNNEDFTVNNGTLTKYNGDGGDVFLPHGIVKIDNHVFEEREDIKSVVIPDGVTTIGNSAFWFCGLTSITIPASVTQFGRNVFNSSDSNLTDVYYGGSKAQWDAISVWGTPGADAAFGENVTVHFNSDIPAQPQQSVNTGFTDVPSTADYAQAVKWAVDKGVTAGTSATTFSPDSVCTRGQIVTFLHRALA